MRKFREIVKKFVLKHGAVIASCAFAFVAFSANSSCLLPFFEPEEPKAIKNFKKFNR